MILLLLGIALLFLFLLVHFIVPYKFLQPVQKSIPSLITNKNLQYEKVSVEIDNHTTLSGLHITPSIQNKNNNTALIILHGISGAKEKFIGISNFIAKSGYPSYVFDLRLHGESTGKCFTYGHEEKQDVSKIIDFIQERNPEYSIGILGHSMGGAIACQALENDSRLQFGIIQSSFRDLTEIFRDYSQRITKGLVPSFLVNYAIHRSGKLGSFDSSSISPIRSLENVSVPILVSHGTHDDKIKYTYGQDLYKAAKSKHKFFYPIEGGKHEGVLDVGGDKYFARIVSFLDSLPTYN